MKKVKQIFAFNSKHFVILLNIIGIIMLIVALWLWVNL